MTTVAKNDYYTVEIDVKKNRMYLTLVGFWKSRDVVPNFIDDIAEATRKLPSGFTVLTDLTAMKTSPQRIADLHIDAQKVLIKGGLRKTAELVGPDAILKMLSSRFSNESGMPRGTFDKKQEAEAWLDKDA